METRWRLRGPLFSFVSVGAQRGGPWHCMWNRNKLLKNPLLHSYYLYFRQDKRRTQHVKFKYFWYSFNYSLISRALFSLISLLFPSSPLQVDSWSGPALMCLWFIMGPPSSGHHWINHKYQDPLGMLSLKYQIAPILTIHIYISHHPIHLCCEWSLCFPR